MASERPTRRRKAPGKFEGTYSSFSGGQDFTAAKGEGIPIRNIGPIVRRLNAAHGGAAELRLLHAAIYGNEGNQATRKEQLLDFQGLKGESAAANDNIRKRATKTLSEYKDPEVVTRLAEVLGFVTSNVHPKKLVPKICTFLLHPDPALCDADMPDATMAPAGDAVEGNQVEAAKPAKSGRKRKSAPAQTSRKAKAQRGRRAASAEEPASIKEESALQTLSEVTHSEAGMSDARPAEAASPAEHAEAPQLATAVSADGATLLSPAPPTDDTAPSSAAAPVDGAPALADASAAPAPAVPATEAAAAPAVDGAEAPIHADLEHEDGGRGTAANDDQPVIAPTAHELEPGKETLVETSVPVDSVGLQDAPQFSILAGALPVTSTAPAGPSELHADVIHADLAEEMHGEAPVGVPGPQGADEVLSAGEAGSDSPDEVPLHSEGAMDVEQPGSSDAAPVAGVPHVAARSSAAAPPVVIPVEGMPLAENLPAPGSAVADEPVAEKLGSHPMDVACTEGTVLVDHPPPTPVHDDVPAGAPPHDVAPGAGVEATGGAADPVAPVPAEPPAEPAPQQGDTPAVAPAVDSAAADGRSAKIGAAGSARSQPARARRSRNVSAPDAAAAVAFVATEHAASVPDVPASEPEPVAAAAGVRTRGRGVARDSISKGGAQEQSTVFRGYVLQLLKEFDSPETTLVRDLRVAMEDKFGIKLDTFNERKRDVVDACGEFFTSLGFAESR